MNKCPYCGADLQENAHFCLYCMHSLHEKQDIKPSPRSRKWSRIAVIGLSVILVAALGIVLLSGLSVFPENDSDIQLIDPQKSYSPVISSQNFVFSANMQCLAGNTEVWDPIWLYYLEPYGAWEKLTTTLHIDAAKLYLYFRNDGTHILATITGLTQATFADGVQLINEITPLVYYDEALARQAFLTPDYPVDIVDGTTLLQLLQMEDTVAQQCDADSVTQSARAIIPVGEGYYVLYELRTRSYQGQTLYDLYIFYGQQ